MLRQVMGRIREDWTTPQFSALDVLVGGIAGTLVLLVIRLATST